MRREGKLDASPIRSEITAGRFRESGQPAIPDPNTIRHGEMTAAQIATLTRPSTKPSHAAGVTAWLTEEPAGL
jgi:hypothetical protein